MFLRDNFENGEDIKYYVNNVIFSVRYSEFILDKLRKKTEFSFSTWNVGNEYSMFRSC